jgi:acyl-CoA synthetase (AMP-forming)/AMP-acid ligase II
MGALLGVRLMNIANLLHRSALAHGARPALLHGDAVLCDYAALGRRVAALAGHLYGVCGVRPGDRVALYAHNRPEYIELLQAIYWMGAVSVPVNYKLHARELAYVLENSGAHCLWVDAALHADALATGFNAHDVHLLGGKPYEEATIYAPLTLAERAGSDLASLFYTSGTTGRPKGVMQTHANLLAMTLCYFSDVDDIRPEDAMVYAAPLSHGAGLYHFAQIARAARHVVPLSGGFEPEELVRLADRIGNLTLFAAPTMVQRLVSYLQAMGADGSGFKTIVYGGGPMYVQDLRRAMDVMGQRFVQIYGQGESPMTITALGREHLADKAHPRWLERIASVGVPHAAVEVRVVDAQGQVLPAGETGEVLVRGAPVMAGYWANAEATAQALRDGWLWTGDLGAMDGDGFLTLKDRSKDVIISGGSNIYPREVEEVLLLHPSVREVAVIGQTDAQWGEVVVAYLVAAGEGPVDDGVLDALCLEHIARFKRPKHYHWLPALPKNSYGKVLKTALRSAQQG